MACKFRVSMKPYKAASFTQLTRDTLPNYVATCETIDPLLYNMKVASMEGLNQSAFGRFFVSIADTFIGVLNSFKTNLTKFTKPLKRSELHEWVESNRLKTFTVDRIGNSSAIDKLPEIEVNLPAQMKVTYLQAVKNVALVYKQLDALNLAKLINSSVTDIFNEISSKGNQIAGKLSDINTAIKQTTAASKATVIECQRNFTGKFVARKKYKDVYEDPKQFNAVTEELLKMEKFLQDVHELTTIIDEIEKTLQGICDGVKDGEVTAQPKDLMTLGEAAKQAALVFDSYGLATTRQMALEHNHILNYNIIFAQVK